MKRIIILVADDDEDDCLLLRESFVESGNNVELHFVENGEYLMDYLNRRNGFSDQSLSPCPDLILLDLNMPAKDGREALREIKSDPKLRRIPVVILTTSSEEEDVLLTYELGASSFITKPVGYSDWSEMVRAIKAYWIRFSTPPPRNREGC